MPILLLTNPGEALGMGDPEILVNTACTGAFAFANEEQQLDSHCIENPGIGPNTAGPVVASVGGSDANAIMPYGPGSANGSFISTGRSWAEASTADGYGASANTELLLTLNTVKNYVFTAGYKGITTITWNEEFHNSYSGSDFGVITDRGVRNGLAGVSTYAVAGERTDSSISSAYYIISYFDLVSLPPFGDVTRDGTRDQMDIMLTQGYIGQSAPEFDLNGDGQVTQADADVILNQLGTVRGDTNLDGDVDLDDFNRLASNMGKAGIWEAGDFDRNGIVNTADFNTLAANYGYPGNSLTPIPEPALGLAFLGFCCVVFHRRRSHLLLRAIG